MSFSKNTPFSKQDAAIAYALIERAVPFPCDALAQSAPLQYKFSQALGRATSVHPGCSHAHLSALASSRLNAVKMNYSDLLGIFPNLMFIFTGASGDGKSIPVWLDTMVMHMYRKKEFQLAMDLHKTQVTAFSLAEQDEAAPPMVEPQKPKEVDELYDAGSTVGLGQMMKATSGRAVWLKHEARKLLKKLMEGTTIGSFDEINQIAEHAYYRNSPANDNSKFSIENPHLVVLWLMHIEELIPHFQTKVGKDDDDSVAGLMRFFIAHFPAVVNKLLPEGPLAELNKLIESDAYFNKLNFDEVATANVNILLILSRLYKEQCQRPDEVGHPELYSKLLGLHSLSFEPDAWRAYVGDFNACSDKVLHAHTKIKTRADASKLSRDKTKLLQFVPTVDLLGKVIRFLLLATLTDPQIEAKPRGAFETCCRRKDRRHLGRLPPRSYQWKCDASGRGGRKAFGHLLYEAVQDARGHVAADGSFSSREERFVYLAKPKASCYLRSSSRCRRTPAWSVGLPLLAVVGRWIHMGRLRYGSCTVQARN